LCRDIEEVGGRKLPCLLCVVSKKPDLRTELRIVYNGARNSILD
jgi:hypothetical protein